jgi:hypothetical protein
MNASARKAQQILKARRNAGKKRTIGTRVRKVTTDTSAVKAVTAALQKVAKKLRETGALGRVQTRIGTVAAGVVGKTYRYTAAQMATIAQAYKARKAEYKAVAAALAA